MDGGAIAELGLPNFIVDPEIESPGAFNPKFETLKDSQVRVLELIS